MTWYDEDVVSFLRSHSPADEQERLAWTASDGHWRWVFELWAQSLGVLLDVQAAEHIAALALAQPDGEHLLDGLEKVQPRPWHEASLFGQAAQATYDTSFTAAILDLRADNREQLRHLLDGDDVLRQEWCRQLMRTCTAYLDQIRMLYYEEYERVVAEDRARSRPTRPTAGLPEMVVTVSAGRSKWQIRAATVEALDYLDRLGFPCPHNDMLFRLAQLAHHDGSATEQVFTSGGVRIELTARAGQRDDHYELRASVDASQLVAVNSDALRGLERPGAACWYVQFGDAVLLLSGTGLRPVAVLLQAASIAQDNVSADASRGTVTRRRGLLGDFWEVTTMTREYRKKFIKAIGVDAGSGKTIEFV